MLYKSFVSAILIILFSQSGYSQRLEIFGGINHTHLRDNGSQEFMTNDGSGTTIGFSFDNYNSKGWPTKISMSYNSYQSDVYTSWTTDALTTTTVAEIDRKAFDLAVYPFTFRIQQLLLNFGLYGSFTVGSDSEGTQTVLGFDPVTVDINELSEPEFHKSWSAGLAARISYEIPIGDYVSIVPQYIANYSVTDEYEISSDDGIKPWRQFFLLGVAVNF